MYVYFGINSREEQTRKESLEIFTHRSWFTITIAIHVAIGSIWANILAEWHKVKHQTEKEKGKNRK